jgi:hypothetical protein
LTQQFRVAFDVYLELQRRVRQRASTALNHDIHCRQRNVCPPCFYKISDEAPLKFSALLAMDGNNSLKLVDSIFRRGEQRIDSRVIQSDKWVTPEEVDIFKDEIANLKLKVWLHLLH